jgi:predicted ATPase
VTGVGGVGKTRLALRVAAQLHATVRTGVGFVDLASVRDPPQSARQAPDSQLVATVIAATLGVREGSARPPLQLLTEYLARRRLLLVLDSCDPVLPACAVLAETLLRACPGLRILATGRELLGVTGEALLVVEPMPVPDPRRPIARTELVGWEAVALFLARAHAAMPGFQLTEANQYAVVGICHRLDGLPLAIELGAAQLRALAPQQILDQLADRFAPLGPPGAAMPNRHRTLRASIDWSFDLCGAAERRLWARLSVFAGGFDLDAVEGICTDQILRKPDVLSLMASLVDKSVVLSDHHYEQTGYRLLDTIRDYGRDKLHETHDEANLRRRHRNWYQQLIARAREDFISVRQPYWLHRLSREHENLRTAMEYSLAEPGEAEAALRMAVTVPWTYWMARGMFGEARRWLDAALAHDAGSATLRARGLLLAGCLAVWQGEVEAGLRQIDQGEAIVRGLDDPANLAHSLYARAMVAGARDDLPTALELLNQALTLLASLPHPELELQLRTLLAVGVNAALSGHRDRADACYRQILAITEPRGGSYYRSDALWALAIEALREGDFNQATAQLTASLRIKRDKLSVDRYGIVLCLEAMAWIAAGLQQRQRAAALLGAADAAWAEIGGTIATHRNLIGDHNACERQTREALGEPEYAAAFRYGRGLTYDASIAYALEQQ